MVRWLSIRLLFVCCAAPSFLQPQRVDAARPCVQFDVVPVAEAEDVSTPEFLAANPSEKLIRIQLPISSLVRLGSENGLLQYLYVISGTTTSPFQIVDYAPSTTLASDVTGPMAVEASTGNATSVGLKALAPQDFPVKADASANLSTSSSNSTRLQKLPPLQLIAASGTMHRGVSAYFKLKPSTQTTLEGDKMFEIVARVHSTWRAGVLQVSCAAFGQPRTGVSGSQADLVCGRNNFVVGTYCVGDEMAKQKVRKLAETQQRLQHLAARHAEHIQDERYPTVAHKVGAALSIVKPRIPDRWLDELLTSRDFHAFERHLPREIRMAATEYREARKQVIGFAG